MEKAIKFCVTGMMDRNIIDESQKGIIIYGLDLLFTSIISLMSFAALGILLHAGVSTWLLLSAFIPLQSFGGGYHCKTHLRCWMTMMVSYLVGMFIFLPLPEYILVCGAVLSFLPVWEWSPVENPKAPFGEVFGRKMRRITICVYFMLLVLAVMPLISGGRCLKEVLVGMIWAGTSVMGAKIIQ